MKFVGICLEINYDNNSLKICSWGVLGDIEMQQVSVCRNHTLLTAFAVAYVFVWSSQRFRWHVVIDKLCES